MPLVAAAVCPHPPLLVPEVASGAAAELDDLRRACADAVGMLRSGGARSVTVVGSGPAAEPDRGAAPSPSPAGPVVGSFAGYGVPLRVTLPAATLVPADGAAPPAQPRPEHAREPGALPLSLTVAAWLLRDLGLPVRMQYVPPATPAAACLAWRLPEPAARPWALLVMGDGSARRGVKAPGYDDPRAEPFDRRVAAALGSADLEALAAIDVDLAAELLCAGRAAWQVLAGAVRRERSPATAAGWRAQLRYHAAPYGVGYFVATWRPAGPRQRAAEPAERREDPDGRPDDRPDQWPRQRSSP